jgi:hypothetical protein
MPSRVRAHGDLTSRLGPRARTTCPLGILAWPLRGDGERSPRRTVMRHRPLDGRPHAYPQWSLAHLISAESAGPPAATLFVSKASSSPRNGSR